MPTAETKNPLALRRDGKGKIWSHIRQDWFVEYPEEVVRQQFVCKLVNDYGFSLDQMDEEIATEHGRGSVEADIVIWRTVKDKHDEKPPIIVAECKADNVTIDRKGDEREIHHPACSRRAHLQPAICVERIVRCGRARTRRLVCLQRVSAIHAGCGALDTGIYLPLLHTAQDD